MSIGMKYALVCMPVVLIIIGGCVLLLARWVFDGKDDDL